jgi:hypothetical protein
MSHRSETYFHLSKFVDFYIKKIENFLSNQNLSTKAAQPTFQYWNFFILKSFSFHFHFVASILHPWLMKFYMPEKWTYWTRSNFSKLFPCVWVLIKRFQVSVDLVSSPNMKFTEQSYGLKIIYTVHLFKSKLIWKVQLEYYNISKFLV